MHRTWYLPASLSLRRWEQKEQEFKVSLSQTEAEAQSNDRASLSGSGGNLMPILVCLARLPLG